jgi:hypothetical protein
MVDGVWPHQHPDPSRRSAIAIHTVWHEGAYPTMGSTLAMREARRIRGWGGSPNYIV